MAKTRRFKQRIQDQILGSILLLLVGIVSVLGIWAYLQSRRMLARELGRRLEQGAGLMASRAPAELIPLVQPHGLAEDRWRAYLREGRDLCGADNALLVDNKGRVLADARGAFQFLEVNHFLDQDRFEMEEALATGKPRATALYEGADGRSYMSAYAPLSGPAGAGRLLVVEASAGFLEQVSSLGRRMFAASLLFLGLAAGWSLVFARSLITPIRRLVLASESVAQGRLDTRLAEDPPNELGFLAQTFNSMVDQMKRHNDALLESLGGGLVACDAGGVVHAFNRGAGALLSLEPSQALGRPKEEALRNLPEGAQILGEVLRRGSAQPVREVRAGKRTLWLQATPLSGPDGRPVGAELLILDQTETARLRDEVALKDRMAALGEMSAQVAHDLRNPLAALQGWVEMARRRASEDQPGSPLARAQDEIRLLNGIVADFLDFARPSPPFREKTDLRGLLDDALRSLDTKAKESGVALRLEAPDKLEAEVDAGKIRRALVNILGNALEASPRGGEVRVFAGPGPEGPEIRVEDQGAGIPAEALERLFQPFVTTKPGGTGLGLAIVQKIVQDHGGRCWGENRRGGGASFGFNLR